MTMTGVGEREVGKIAIESQSIVSKSLQKGLPGHVATVQILEIHHSSGVAVEEEEIISAAGAAVWKKQPCAARLQSCDLYFTRRIKKSASASPGLPSQPAFSVTWPMLPYQGTPAGTSHNLKFGAYESVEVLGLELTAGVFSR